jgi:hypothetical protein
MAIDDGHAGGPAIVRAADGRVDVTRHQLLEARIRLVIGIDLIPVNDPCDAFHIGRD